MKSIDRREAIARLLMCNNKAIKGIELANKFKVTRQIIVKDIAILRAKGANIIATPDGYIYNMDRNRVKAIIAVNHGADKMIEELQIVVKYGGVIENVIVEHPLYGEIIGNLMIKNLNDLNKFEDSFKNIDAKPLAEITNGIHLHTISADTEEEIENIKKELELKGFSL